MSMVQNTSKHIGSVPISKKHIGPFLIAELPLWAVICKNAINVGTKDLCIILVGIDIVLNVNTSNKCNG